MKIFLLSLSLLLSLVNINSQCNYNIDSLFGVSPFGNKIFDTSMIINLSYETFVNNTDSNYYLLGQSIQNSKNLGTILKLDKNGNIDKSFGNNGKIFIDTSLNGELDYGIEINQNEILVCGKRSIEVFVAKYDKSGNLIKGFAKNGIFADKKTFTGGEGTEIKFDSDQNIYISGYSTLRDIGPFVLKLKPNGSIDSTFATNGYYRLITPIETFEAKVHLEIINDGLVFGYSTGSLNLSEIVVSKLDFKGKIDSMFGNKGILKLPNLSNMFLHSISKINGDILLFGECRISNKPYAILSKIFENGKFNYNFDALGYKLYDANLAKTEIKCKNQLLIGSAEIVNNLRICSLQNIDLITGNIDTTFGNKGRLNFPFQPNQNEHFFVSDIILKNNYVSVIGHTSNLLTCMARGKSSISTQTSSVQTSEKINCYPIPCSDYLTIDNLPVTNENLIEIFDNNLRSVEFIKAKGGSKYIINCSKWLEGIYFIRVSNFKNVNTFKVIKN